MTISERAYGHSVPTVVFVMLIQALQEVRFTKFNLCTPVAGFNRRTLPAIVSQFCAAWSHTLTYTPSLFSVGRRATFPSVALFPCDHKLKMIVQLPTQASWSLHCSSCTGCTGTRPRVAIPWSLMTVHPPEWRQVCITFGPRVFPKLADILLCAY